MDPFRMREAVGPVLNLWLGRAHGELTFHLTQILTRHAVVGVYLHCIEKADTLACEHCVSAVDIAHHTLEECPAWAQKRAALREVDDDLSLSTIVHKILRDGRRWRAAVAFGDAVMSAKEDAAWARQGQPARRVVPGEGSGSDDDSV